MVSDVRVADGEIATRLAAANVGPVAWTALEVDGPMIAIVLGSETYFWASVDASAGSSCVSPW